MPIKVPQRSRVVLRSRVPVEHVEPWKGRHPDGTHYDLLLHGSCEVRGPAGELVVVLCRDVLSEQAVAQAKPVLHWMRRFTSDNRALYAGAEGGNTNMVKADGTLSRSNRALDADGNRVVVASTIGGYYEQQGGRHPFCRATGFTRSYPEQWSALQPIMQECASVYQQVAPVRYAKQRSVVNETHPAWIIPGTPFTTITVNNTVAAAYHQDGGDLKEGMGILCAFEHGTFDGFELVVPEYRIAVRLRDRDVLLFNPLVWHGNVPPHGQVGEQDVDWWRASLVLYYRDGIRGCLSPQAELAKAKQRGAL